jgi:hypothetical protein
MTEGTVQPERQAKLAVANPELSGSPSISKTTGRKGQKVFLHCKRVMISVSFLRNQLVRTRQPRWMEIHQIDLLSGFD